ncbi:MAG: carbamoyl-phosphate synthase (glutamine-hydrolyzing) large subunit [Thermoprotei archaeon]
MPKKTNIRKVLVLGSGAIKIGEAGEFDYSGSQCLKALREEGIKTILVNPNIATIQTDENMADKIYFLPVTPEYVEEAIKKERPDSIILTFGGQTALNCGIKLAKMGILDNYNVKVLGTSIETIENASDRERFKKVMIEAGLPVPRSKSAHSLEEAKIAAKEIGYPVIIRVAFTLGGKGGGVAKNEEELINIVEKGLAHSLIKEVLIEEYLGGLKQIEYEVMRDYEDNCIVVCNMENVLGMRVHTGDNIVVAPSQTLNNREYHILRSAAIKAARALNVVGECNVQFALDPNTNKYYVIEVNPRMSRSSALASKATGYPLAYIAAKLALGYTLPELINNVTGITTAAFEPALDYIVIKIPRWDFKKFPRVDRKLRTQMKSVGEVMAIGRRFEEALQKAVRMLDIGLDGLVANYNDDEASLERIKEMLTNPTDEILLYIVRALKKGLSIEEISKLSEIDPWFINKIKNIVDMEKELLSLKEKINNVDEKTLYHIIKKAKQLGFSDKQIAKCLGSSEESIRNLRKKLNINPVVKQIDTLAAEWPAKTNYLYITYNGDFDDTDFISSKRKVIVLGAGPYRIGSSVEFDWCTMNMVWALKAEGFDETIVINCNPETVSTDYDMSDKLYFEELTLERVFDIYEKEKPDGIVVNVGGQTANNLAPKLAKWGARILGTDSNNIDKAEDRAKFSQLLDVLNIKQPPWKEFTTLEEAQYFAQKVGYPILVRPSYVLSGAAMKVVWTPTQLKQYILEATKISHEHPVIISKFFTNSMEIEVDGVSDGENIVIGSIIEHVEPAGVHSGDAIMVIPPIRITQKIREKIIEYTIKIAKALNIKGPFNIQYLAKNDDVYVIECNLRASRSMPFVSKTTDINLMKLAAHVLVEKKLPNSINMKTKTRFSVKVPQFSFMQLDGTDPILSVEMQSTGEVACFGDDFHEALTKALIAAEYKMPKLGGNIFVSVGDKELKEKILKIALELKKMGYNIIATEHTAEYLMEHGIDNIKIVYKFHEKARHPNISEYLKERLIDLVINIPSSLSLEKYSVMLEDEHIIRRRAIELGIPVITNIATAEAFIEGLKWLASKNQLTNLIKN